MTWSPVIVHAIPERLRRWVKTILQAASALGPRHRPARAPARPVPSASRRIPPGPWPKRRCCACVSPCRPALAHLETPWAEPGRDGARLCWPGPEGALAPQRALGLGAMPYGSRRRHRSSGGGPGGSGGALASGGQPGPSPGRRAADVGTLAAWSAQAPRAAWRVAWPQAVHPPGRRGLLAVPAARAAPAGGRAGRAPLAGRLRPSHGTPSQEGSVWHVLRPF